MKNLVLPLSKNLFNKCQHRKALQHRNDQFNLAINGNATLKQKKPQSLRTIEAFESKDYVLYLSHNIGRGDRIRTCDLMVPNHARYQLRYAPTHKL
jgi:hypothetical protein